MLYAFVIGATAVITAADSQDEYDAVTVETLDGLPAQARFAEAIDMLSNPQLHGFKSAILVEFTDPALQSEPAIKNVLLEHNISVQGRMKALSRQEKMANAPPTDIFSLDDGRTLAEILGLTENDPWDRRTEEQKIADQQMQKAYDEAKKGGNLSGDSFNPTASRDPTARVWDVKAHEENGEIKIDSAIAVKGLWDHLGETDSAVLPNPYRIENSPFDTLFRTDLIGITMEELEAAFVTEGQTFERLTVGRGAILETDLPVGVPGIWTVAGLERIAQKVANIAVGVYPTVRTEVYGVNAEGERLIPKDIGGVTVVDVNAGREIGPRPWDAKDRAKEFRTAMAALPKADREKKWRKEVKGDEFIYSGSHDPIHGSVVFVVPISYWNRHQKFYPFKLNIEHILPRDFVEEAPGRYRTRSRDWNAATYAMAQSGIEESMMIRLYLNSLG